MSIDSCNQPKKALPKSDATSQGQNQDQSKDSQVKQGVKTFEKARKDKKQKSY